ncbi:MAG: DUF3857 domain-containing protein, partial [Marinilabiliaceae bacterium]|nr:DUF3857 domain-containing protein [Marinilabiliaceae bacterium]
MKKHLLLLVAVFLFNTIIVMAQSDPDWTGKPVLHEIPDSLLSEKVIYLHVGINIDFRHNDDGQLEQYYSYYRKVKIMDDEYINQFNKIEISLNNTLDVEEIKARSINPDGKVIEFNRDNIREISDIEDDGSSQIFVIDGVEAGSEVEVFYRKKMTAQNFGTYYFQYSYPLLAGHFELTSPAELHYKLKGYNGAPAIQSSSTEEMNIYRADFSGINKLVEEEYAYYQPRRTRIEYKLEINENRGKYPLLTWDDAAARLYNTLYGLEKGEQKAIEKFIDKLQLNSQVSLTDLRKIENTIKSSISIQEYNIPEYMDMEFVLKNSVSGTAGHTRLLVNILKLLGVEHKILLTCSRDSKIFDSDFGSWNSLENYLIYLPGLDEYINPESFDDRIGYVDGLLRATYGLRIEPVRLRNIETAIGYIDYIEPTDYKKNSHNTYVNFSVNPSSGSAIVKTEDCFRGLGGGILKEYYNLIEENNREDFLKEIILVDLPAEDFTEISASTETVNDKENFPDFCITYSLDTKEFLEFAGNNILVKIGESIGPQVEMYQKEERRSDVQNDFNRWYWRVIDFYIPDGYRIKNPEISKFDVVYESDGKKIYGFESDYSIDGDKYTIIIDEYYKNIFLEREHFEEF